MNKMQINSFGRLTDIWGSLIHEGYAVMVIQKGDGYEVTYKRPGDEEPAPEVEVGVAHSVLSQGCASCKYRDNDAFSEPCCVCSHGVELKDYWTLREYPGGELQCYDCKYYDLDCVEEPCIYCENYDEFVEK